MQMLMSTPAYANCSLDQARKNSDSSQTFKNIQFLALNTLLRTLANNDLNFRIQYLGNASRNAEAVKCLRKGSPSVAPPMLGGT